MSGKKDDGKIQSKQQNSHGKKPQENNEKLYWGSKTNYRKWSDFMENYLMAKYKNHCNFVMFGKYDDEPQLFPPIGGFNSVNDPDKTLKLMYQEELKFNLRNKMEFQNAKGAIWADIMLHLSLVSQEKVRDMAEYQTHLDDHRNVLELWKLIKKVHSGVTSGTDGVLDRQEARNNLMNLKQTAYQSPMEFKRVYEDAVKLLVDLGGQEPTEETQVQDYLQKLDVNRFGEVYSELVKSVHFSHGEYPKTLNLTVELVTTYSRGIRIMESGKQKAETVFISKTTNEKKEKKKQVKSESPPLDNSDGTENWLSKIKCHNCGKFGHFARNCSLPDKRLLKREHISVIKIELKDESIMLLDNIYKENLNNSNTLLLDSCASISLANNESILSNIRKTKHVYMVKGITKHALEITLEGDLEGFGTVLYHPKALANIISLSAMTDTKVDISFDKVNGFEISNPSTRKKYLFERISDGMYAFKLGEHTSTEKTMIATISENEKLFTKREVESAREARVLQKKLGFAPTDSIVSLLQSGGIINLNTTTYDLKRADEIYGKDVASLKGRMTRSKDPTFRLEHIPLPLIKNLVMHVDVMYISGLTYLLSTTKPLCLVMVTRLDDGRKYSSILDALQGQIDTYKRRGFVIDHISSDGEGSIAKIKSEQGKEIGSINATINVNISGAGQHDSTIERRIRQVKERVRSVLHSLPYNLPGFLLDYAVYFVIMRINMFPSATSMDHISPFEKFYGRKLDYKRDLRVEFGEYAQVYSPHGVSNSMQQRSEACIALISSGNVQGSVKFFNITSKKIVTRDKWKALPITDTIINILNKFADNCPNKIEKYHSRVAIGTSINQEEELDEPELKQNIVNEDQSEIIIEPETTTRIILDEPITNISPNDVINEEVVEYEKDINQSDDNKDESIEVSHRYHTRNSGNDDPVMKYLEQGILHISHKQAIKLFGQVATEESLLKEAKQMLDKKVWVPQEWKKLTEEQRKTKTLQVFSFYKDKWFPDGTFEKLKEREVVNGSRQDRAKYGNIYSPTVAVTSVFFVAATAAVEKRFVKKFDIPGAYLNTDIEEEIYLLIGKSMADIVCKLDSAFKIGVRKDGSMVVKLMKGQYGCVESAKLWYLHIKQTLESHGFKINPIDGSVFNCIRNGEQITICIHVDDGLITSKSLSNVDWAMNFLSEQYGKLTIHEGERIPYTGMMFDFSVKGFVTVGMEKYIADIRTEYQVQGTAKTPASQNLFVVEEKSLPLSSNKLKEFHSRVMKLMWIAKRCVPEILVAISYLSTRVQSANESDWQKLERVLKYLNNDDKFEIRFGCKDGNQNIKIDAYVDVSHAVHGDYRGHTGDILRFNDGPAEVGSSKQKVNTKSTAESEMVGFTDKSGSAIMYKAFAEHQGYAVDAITIYQDNKSTIRLLEKGHSTSMRTRHINIRYFYLKDRIDRGDIKIEYCKSEDMLADMFTKPLQGKLFYRLRSLIRNLE